MAGTAGVDSSGVNSVCAEDLGIPRNPCCAFPVLRVDKVRHNSFED